MFDSQLLCLTEESEDCSSCALKQELYDYSQNRFHVSHNLTTKDSGAIS